MKQQATKTGAEFLTVRQLCDLYGMSLSTFQRRHKANDLPPRYKFGQRQWRFLKEEAISHMLERKESLR